VAPTASDNTSHNIQASEKHNQVEEPTASDYIEDNNLAAETHNQVEEPTTSYYIDDNYQTDETYNQIEEPTASDNIDDNDEADVTISMSNGKQFKLNTNALLKAAIAILAVIALFAILKNCNRNRNNYSTNDNATNEVVTAEPETGKGWEYDINGNEVIASIKSDDNTVTVKYNEVANPNSLVVVMNTAKVPMFKDNKLGIAFNDTKRWCEFHNDQNASSPTYLVNIDKNILDLLKDSSKFSLIFADDEVTFSSSKALNMPSPDPIQQIPIAETTPAQSPKPSAQPKPKPKAQPKPQQESTRASSDQRSREIYDQPSHTQTIDIEDEQTVDRVFADPERVRNYPKPSNAPKEPTIKESSSESAVDQRYNELTGH